MDSGTLAYGRPAVKRLSFIFLNLEVFSSLSSEIQILTYKSNNIYSSSAPSIIVIFNIYIYIYTIESVFIILNTFFCVCILFMMYFILSFVYARREKREELLQRIFRAGRGICKILVSCVCV